MVPITKLTELKNRKRMSKNSRHFTFRPIRSKTKTKCDSLTHVFPRLYATFMTLIRFLDYRRLLLLSRVITGVSVLRHSTEKDSSYGGFHVLKGLFREKTKFFGNLETFRETRSNKVKFSGSLRFFGNVSQNFETMLQIF